ncbi:MAG: hypothetical protein H7067_11060 [Burkholderiales bacterium]|nr:hypothetical protein [Opitutaceae bacterium]
MRHKSRTVGLAAIATLALATFGGGGCVYIQPPRIEVSSDTEQSAEQILGTYLLLSALGGAGAGAGANAADGLATLALIFPLRTQLVTQAVIGFHRDRGAWPTTADELHAYAESSPANPRLPADVLDGFVAERHENGDLTYSTREDRQHGRHVKITSAYRVTLPVPAALFAAPDSAELSRVVGGSTLNLNWSETFPPATPATPAVPSLPLTPSAPPTPTTP